MDYILDITRNLIPFLLFYRRKKGGQKRFSADEVLKKVMAETPKAVLPPVKKNTGPSSDASSGCSQNISPSSTSKADVPSTSSQPARSTPSTCSQPARSTPSTCSQPARSTPCQQAADESLAVPFTPTTTSTPASHSAVENPPSAQQALHFGGPTTDLQLASKVNELVQVVFSLSNKLETAMRKIEASQRDMATLLKEVKTLTEAKEAAGMVTEDVLPKPMETEAEFDAMCGKLVDDSFKRTLVSLYLSLYLSV